MGMNVLGEWLEDMLAKDENLDEVKAHIAKAYDAWKAKERTRADFIEFVRAVTHETEPQSRG